MAAKVASTLLSTTVAGGLLAALYLCTLVHRPSSASSQQISSAIVGVDQQEPVEHPLSRRIRRQAYPVFGAGESGLSVDSIDQEGQGPWLDWEIVHDCSRTCGGGVQIQTRKCAGTGCTGPRKRYVSCNIEPCPVLKDFRADQCTKFDDSPLEGKFYKWKPYTRASNKCELNCIPDGENFYYKWSDKVIDGTRCDAFGYDICVEGYCVPVGCDKKLGSALKEDRCRICGGDGSTCKTIEGFFDEADLKPGYHDVIVIPAGATAIVIQERKPSNNYLALRSEGGIYWLNGNWKIDFPQTVEAAGTLFDYERTKHNNVAFEKLYAKGPTKEPVVVVLLRQTENSGIQYEFSVPLKDAMPYQYSVGAWSDCSVTCGQGIQTRTIQCKDRVSKKFVDDHLCVNSTVPELNRSCETVDCEPSWFVGDWEPCSESCGNGGMQYRIVYCQRAFGDGSKVTLDDSLCEGDRPAFKQSCNRFACPEWHTGPWSSCTSACGPSHQYRAVSCRSEKEGDEGKILPSRACHLPDEPANRRPCNLGVCEGLNWHTTDWKLCERCNDTTESRNVSCVDQTGRHYPDYRCSGDKPAHERPCATVIPCVYKWHTSQWSECSTQCGHGHQTRSVLCAIEAGNKLIKMDESQCTATLKPDDRQNCTSEAVCKGTYFTSQWEDCSAPCGGGKQKRTVLCFDYDFRLNPAMCDEAVKPADAQDCNLDPCLTPCNETEFGCCPDTNSTATGPYLAGCSNCSLTEFGCCPDNVTYAAGPYMEGCSNCSLTEFGCCQDNVTSALGANWLGCDLDLGSGTPFEADNDTAVLNCTDQDGMVLVDSECVVKMCNYTSDAGVVLEVPCVNVTLLYNTTTADSDASTTLLANGTAAANETDLHCSKTTFGCCPDWVTPAEGEDDATGCPVYQLGDCAESANATVHGCCPDNLTLARGSEYEGCGDLVCAATLYGCCQDRHTIAFGTHYKGCERAAVSCESTAHGCCADGKTAALGAKGEGCLQNCLLSKYGCCPDGKTVANGPNNAGCGCSVSQYGCCPDGQTTATGPSFQGCPQGCATTHYGCCPDGTTVAKGPDYHGCACRHTKYGCCRDGRTAADGPNMQGCRDCQTTPFGCCPDGKKAATGARFQGCFETAPRNVTSNQVAACSLPVDNGNCAEYALNWYYDGAEGLCRQFWYGGCDGNDNRFATEAECKHVCISPPGPVACHLPRVAGSPSCGPTTIRWYYDSQQGYCLQFYYNCNGNANNFMDRESCQQRCEGVVGQPTRVVPAQPSGTPAAETTDQQPTTTTEEDICSQPMDVGPCKGRIQQWYYEPATGACQTFIWGGCDGNANRFASRAQCEAKCAEVIEDFCKLPKDPGPCDQYTPKWFYKHEDGTCNRFYYGGCHGNANRFETMEECDDQCASRVDPCILPAVPGPCAGRNPMYFFNSQSQSCEQFHYGGCLGNSNRFGTVEECQRRCQSSGTRPTVAPTGVFSVSRVDHGSTVSRELCHLPKETGPCRAYIPSFYYDPVARSCASFVYGGCQGNANRFGTLQQCEAACGQQGTRLQNLMHEERNDLAEGAHSDDLDQQLGSNELDAYRSHMDYCNEPANPGQCADSILRWYYDPRSGHCNEFTYGGCGGNRNNFDSREDCQRVCTVLEVDSPVGDIIVQHGRADDHVLVAGQQPRRPTAVQTNYYGQPSSLVPDLCRQAKDVGNCYGSTLSWYYDSERMQCDTFKYTGCGGNSNRFTSEEGCQRACGLYRDQDVCTMAADEGPCLTFVPKWYYNATTNQCVSFAYGGCEGNGNRFSSKEECQNACHRQRSSESRPTDVCSMERDPGPCVEPISQFYFDMASQQCKLFTYGGCRGNGNRFNTREECESRCGQQLQTTGSAEDSAVGRTPAAVCSLAFDAGPCHNSQQKWYYDGKTERCRHFVYGGCGGNGNRFDSERQCLKMCAPGVEQDQRQQIDGQQIALRIDSMKFTYTEGQTVTLDCSGGAEALHHVNNVIWYKDGRPLMPDRRLQIQLNGSLVIGQAGLDDSGDFNCALLQPAGAFSKSVRLTIQKDQRPAIQEQLPADCVDNPALANCRLVVTADLCGHSYYGRYCCATCRSSSNKRKRSGIVRPVVRRRSSVIHVA